MRRSVGPLLVSSLVFGGCGGPDDGRGSAGSAASGVGSGVVSVTASGSGGGGSSGSEGTSGGGEGSGSGGSGASEGTSEGTSAGTSAASASGGGAKFDLGSTPDGGLPPEPAACLKVDLLFVVDNSGSMKNEQDNLVASFPGFVQEIQEQLVDAESLHIGVVTTDSYDWNSDPCDNVLGALVTKTGGANSSNKVCGPYASGLRFMNEQDDLGTRFACAGQVGTAGSSNEKPLDAAIKALGPQLGAPGQCNEGFLRDDALLVLVIITDEEEEGSAGDPPDWFNALAALKGGIETNIVTLALIGPENPECAQAAEIGHRIIDFAEMFTFGSIGQICADSYQPFFHDAIAVIDEACDVFVPPG